MRVIVKMFLTFLSKRN